MYILLLSLCIINLLIICIVPKHHHYYGVVFLNCGFWCFYTNGFAGLVQSTTPDENEEQSKPCMHIVSLDICNINM